MRSEEAFPIRAAVAPHRWSTKPSTIPESLLDCSWLVDASLGSLSETLRPPADSASDFWKCP